MSDIIMAGSVLLFLLAWGMLFDPPQRPVLAPQN